MGLDTTICAVKNCDSAHYAQGLCNKHYQRLRLTGTVYEVAKSALDRFLSLVDKRGDDECWLWSGSVGSNGYGQIFADGKHWSAHRFSHTHLKGQIPSGMYVLHSCDNKLCVNPKHLSAGTAAKNSREASERKRMVCGESHPKSKLTSENIAFIKANVGMSNASLARMFSVWPNAIKSIRDGKSWKHA